MRSWLAHSPLMVWVSILDLVSHSFGSLGKGFKVFTFSIVDLGWLGTFLHWSSHLKTSVYPQLGDVTSVSRPLIFEGNRPSLEEHPSWPHLPVD